MNNYRVILSYLSKQGSPTWSDDEMLRVDSEADLEALRLEMRLKRKEEERIAREAWAAENGERVSREFDELFDACKRAKGERWKMVYPDGTSRRHLIEYEKLWKDKYGAESQKRDSVYVSLVYKLNDLRAEAKYKGGMDLKHGVGELRNIPEINIMDQELLDRAYALAYSKKRKDVDDGDWRDHVRSVDNSEPETPPSWGDWVKPKGKR